MDFDEQLRLIRIRKNMEFDNYLASLSPKEAAYTANINSQCRIEKQNFEEKLLNKSTNQLELLTTMNAEEESGFESDKKLLDEPVEIINSLGASINDEEKFCINYDDINHILPIYRFVINITNQHTNEYSEQDVDENLIEMHRHIYRITTPQDDNFPLFKYCFDIRILYPQKNNIIEIENNFYFLQPDDHIKINARWKEIFGNINYPIEESNSAPNINLDFDDSYLDALNMEYMNGMNGFCT